MVENVNEQLENLWLLFIWWRPIVLWGLYQKFKELDALCAIHFVEM